MKLFVWERAEDVTTRYHSSAGVLVVAESLHEARDALKCYRTNNKDYQVEDAPRYISESSRVFTDEPDYTTDVSAAEEKIIVFPNAGCC